MYVSERNEKAPGCRLHINVAFPPPGRRLAVWPECPRNRVRGGARHEVRQALAPRFLSDVTDQADERGRPLGLKTTALSN